MPKTKKTEEKEGSPVDSSAPAEEKEEKSSWIKIKPQELEKIIVDLAKQGNSPAKIGLILRDKHGIPKTRLLGKKVTQILKEANVKYTTEKEIVENKITNLKSHMGKNKYDNTAKKSLAKRLWLLHTLNKNQ
ncbi:MAG: hypothetical protein Q7S27_04725 [Nanoarchaeota archaeon]|nr:hypothetical protein [Nanoarchaeota archaeon]